MRIECEGDGRYPGLISCRSEPADDRRMTEMHAVKIANRHGRGGQRRRAGFRPEDKRQWERQGETLRMARQTGGDILPGA